MSLLAQRARDEGLVVLAGSGISMMPPTSLPNWNQFNTAVLTAIAKRVGAYTSQRFADDELEAFIQRRDSTCSFAPDFQAQLIAEECGLDYFRVLQALDSDERNACHEAIAALAKDGFVRAIVTTNFDRLIERALDAANVSYRVFYSINDFSHLVTQVQIPHAELSLVKVHGSVQAPESMVDTLAQRVAGRPKSLKDALITLLGKHHWLVLGFSGADLDYDPNYLGLRRAMPNVQGMTFLNRTGSQPRAAMRELVDVYGANSQIFDGTLPQFLQELQSELGQTPVPNSASAPSTDRTSALADHAKAWVDSLGDMQAINIFSALMDAAGNEEGALRFLRKVWRFYRAPQDIHGDTYWRYNYNYGRRLLERGELGQNVGPIDTFLERVKRGEADFEELDNGYQFLARAAGEGHLADAYIDLALTQALLGGPRRGLEIITPLIDEMAKGHGVRQFIDAVIVFATIAEMAGAWSDALSHLNVAHDLVHEYGDEIRRAKICVLMARQHVLNNEFEQAKARIADAKKISDRLVLSTIRADAEAAQGLLEVNRGNHTEALEHLIPAYNYYAETSRKPRMVLILPEIARAAYATGQDNLLKQSLESWREMGTDFAGYEPHYHILMLELYALNAQWEDAYQSLAKLRQASQETQNDWGLKMADFKEGILKQMQASQG